MARMTRRLRSSKFLYYILLVTVTAGCLEVTYQPATMTPNTSPTPDPALLPSATPHPTQTPRPFISAYTECDLPEGEIIKDVNLIGTLSYRTEARTVGGAAISLCPPGWNYDAFYPSLSSLAGCFPVILREYSSAGTAFTAPSTGARRNVMIQGEGTNYWNTGVWVVADNGERVPSGSPVNLIGYLSLNQNDDITSCELHIATLEVISNQP
jgi:hypothetical protein